MTLISYQSSATAQLAHTGGSWARDRAIKTSQQKNIRKQALTPDIPFGPE